MSTSITHLECSKTGEKYNANTLQSLSAAGKPLLARYDFEKAAKTLTKETIKNRPWNLWRYKEVLPIFDIKNLVTLNEGGTPLYRADNLGRQFGFKNLYIKDESVNPTGSFKARGLAVAVNAALERGAQRFSIPTAGNAGGALAAYAAASGTEAFVFMPSDTPEIFKVECRYFGANLTLVDGLISDCGKMVDSMKADNNWFDVATLKEPYRLEGKKTMGYELAEQFEFELPDVIIYPTGGGTGLIGMWKAFDEMEQLGWIGKKRPRMISVQAENCAPIVKAFNERADYAESWPDAQTTASGIRVPSAIGDFLILEAIYKSSGYAASVSDEEMIESAGQIAAHTGIFPAPEGGAVLAAAVKLREIGLISSDEHVVLFNTGSGYKYPEAMKKYKFKEKSGV
ncbi:MAG: threonine synthase [Balneolaceae bacterium]